MPLNATEPICLSDPKFRYRPRPNENCLFRIRWASSMPANVMAALPNDLKQKRVLRVTPNRYIAVVGLSVKHPNQQDLAQQ